MTDEQKAAIEWLENGLKCWNPATKAKGATLKAMLAEPTLPKEPSDDAIQAMLDEVGLSAAYTISMRQSYRALYAHLTMPKTGRVWDVIVYGKPWDTQHQTLEAAVDKARWFLAEGHQVTVYPREVPA